MDEDEFEDYDREVELALYREYRDVVGQFTYVVETERRFYLANEVERRVHTDGGRTVVELELHDAWVWDMYRQNRFVSSVSILPFKDVNIELLPSQELDTGELG